MITLISNGDGTYTEHAPSPDFPDAAATWVRDSYTEPREAEFECDDCHEVIGGCDFWTCMDGGEAAHIRCVTVVPLPFPVSIDPSPAAPGPAWEWPEQDAREQLPCEVNDCDREAWLCACGNAHCNQHPHIPDGSNPVTGIAYND